MRVMDKSVSRAVKIDTQFLNKGGVFFNKDAKMTTIQNQNKALAAELEQEMTLFQQLAKQIQANKSKAAGLENENNLLQVDEMLTKQEVNKLKSYYQSVEPTLDQKSKTVSQSQQQLANLNEQLERMLSKNQQATNLVKRYRQEIRMEKTLAKSEKNLNSICESLRKNHENYLKNVDILQNKLESKNKYLGILLKKIEKKQKTQTSKQLPVSGKKELRNYHSATRLQLSRANHEQVRQEEEKQKPTSKNNLKGYNDLIRKKNAILAKKK